MGKGGTAGFVNAVLRKFSQNQIPMPTKEDLSLSINYSYPLFILQKLLKLDIISSTYFIYNYYTPKSSKSKA